LTLTKNPEKESTLLAEEAPDFQGTIIGEAAHCIDRNVKKLEEMQCQINDVSLRLELGEVLQGMEYIRNAMLSAENKRKNIDHQLIENLKRA